ncbi:MAG: ABC transporter permease, partial [Acidimicrobiia bacterium]|nr:ABC transporter permease [Acidimicrobiia bacterium]
MLRSELSDLWIGGKAIVFLILFSLLLGVMTFLFATNKELSLTPPAEALFLMVKTTLAVGLLFGLVLGADTISGERERATIESLLLTPVRRRDVVIGKYLAALSPWPAAMAVAAGYLLLIAPDGATFVSAFGWTGFIGTVIVAALTGFGVLVSVMSATNKASLSTSLLVYILFLVPTQLPGSAQAGAVGELIRRINPLDAVNQFLDKLLVSNATFDELASWLLSPLVMFVLVLLGLILVAPQALRLEPP